VTASAQRYILVVDDEAQIIRSINRELSDWAEGQNLTVTGTVIGPLALEFIEEHEGEVPLVIADIRMPGMSGGDMALEIKRRYPNIKIIVLTAYNDRSEIDKARTAGIHAFMTKPWDRTELIRAIESALN
jgi:CheY-like chemotaxis protein